MLTVAIARPLSTYTSFLSFFAFSIYMIISSQPPCRISRCKPWLLHPHTPWRSVVPLGELRSSAEGQVPFLWGSSRQLFQLWFVNWSSSMVLITPRRLHSNNWPVMCTMKHWMSTSNILQGFWVSPKLPTQLTPWPSPPPLKLHYKVQLHIMGLCPIIQTRYLLQ